jgi:NADH dehydrogenase
MIIESLDRDHNDTDVQFPLRDIIKQNHAKVVVAEVLAIDLTNQRVKTNIGTHTYDYLVIAMGSKPHYYGIEGASRYAQSVKTIADVESIVSKLSDTDADNPLSISIVGAVPTGVELAAKIAHLTRPNQIISSLSKKAKQVQLIEAADHILNNLSPSLRQEASELLALQGVNIKTHAAIQKVSRHGLQLSDGSIIKSDLIIWTAGVAPTLPIMTTAVAQNKNGQIITDAFMRVLGYKNVFALGDIANLQDEENLLPTSAQAAVAASSIVAQNITAHIRGAKLKAFQYRSGGVLIPLNKWNGVGQVGRLNIHGPIVWVGWKVIYVWRFPIAKRRLLIAWRLLLRTLS